METLLLGRVFLNVSLSLSIKLIPFLQILLLGVQLIPNSEPLLMPKVMPTAIYTTQVVSLYNPVTILISVGIGGWERPSQSHTIVPSWRRVLYKVPLDIPKCQFQSSFEKQLWTMCSQNCLVDLGSWMQDGRHQGFTET